MPKKILVHCCCGPCATASIERLIEKNWQPVLHFQNSNIFPAAENDKRFCELEKVAKYYNLEVLRGVYDHAKWLEAIRGLEAEPEHGKRCLKCFEFNLQAAYQVAKTLKIEYFTTTLSVSRYKNSQSIFEVGNRFDGFVCEDFKKQNGYARSIELSKQLGLYRQGYCGCEFSLNDAAKDDRTKQSDKTAENINQK